MSLSLLNWWMISVSKVKYFDICQDTANRKDTVASSSFIDILVQFWHIQYQGLLWHQVMLVWPNSGTMALLRCFSRYKKMQSLKGIPALFANINPFYPEFLFLNRSYFINFVSFLSWTVFVPPLWIFGMIWLNPPVPFKKSWGLWTDPLGLC